MDIEVVVEQWLYLILMMAVTTCTSNDLVCVWLCFISIALLVIIEIEVAVQQ